MTHSISRRDMLIAMGAAMGSTAAAPFAWSPIPAGDAGLAADLGDRIDAAQRNGELRGLHGLLVARRGRLALERYYAGVDETWGRPLGQVAFGPDTLHDLRSVTKSLVGLLYGIALADGCKFSVNLRHLFSAGLRHLPGHCLRDGQFRSRREGECYQPWREARSSS
jgi:CubicO group peptidase (beta-lactamase class C family)